MTDLLYNRLPSVYRARDAARGEPLRALLGILEKEILGLQGHLDGAYDDAFIETCAEWVVPYVGDLLGVRSLHPVSTRTFSPRGFVANTLAYRRRKGTAAMLEQLARDVTGWPARAVEFFELLETTQHLDHVRRHSLRTPDLRDSNRLELIDGPFENAAHTADVRRIVRGRGKYNIPNVGLFLWRVQPYSVERSTAAAAGDPTHGRYTFSPLGLDDVPLFNRPRTEEEITHLAEEINVPGRLRRRALFDELEARRVAVADGVSPTEAYFQDPPVVEVFVDDEADPVLPEEMLICNLTEWKRPPPTKAVRRSDGSPATQQIRVSIDPVAGRLAFPTVRTPAKVEVSFTYGFSGDTGGGPYDRTESLEGALDRPVDWQIGVGKRVTPVPGQVVPTLAEAITAWNALPEGKVGIISILDSASYVEALTGLNRIVIPEGSRLVLVAADWPEPRTKGRIVANYLRPHVRGDIEIEGTAAADGDGGELILNGLLIDGQVTGLDGRLGRLGVIHSTAVPGRGGVEVAAGNERLTVEIRNAITGAIQLAETVPGLELHNSIVDGDVAAPGAATVIEACTMFGRVEELRSLEAGNSIFAGRVICRRRQTGCVRFCVLPIDSRTPKRFRCQPDLVLEDVPVAEQPAVRARLTPTFTSRDYGRPGYAQLGRTCAAEIRTGGDDGAEMGAFFNLKQPQREGNLRASLDEYLRFGLQAGIFTVT